jgi:trehalose 6-phosphate synthase
MAGPGERSIVIVSNRGPVSYRFDDDGLPVARRGAGGLVSGLAPLVRGTSTAWIAAAITDADRAAAGQGLTDVEGFRVRVLALDPDDFAAAYDTVSNEALWFAHHGLFDPVYAPAWPAGWVDGPWAAYRRVNQAFAAAVVADAPPDAVVLVQDYHLSLVARSVREARPDLRLVHFSHTPFAPPPWMAMLPAVARREVLEGMAAHHACGFHTHRWAADFTASCVVEGVAPPEVFVAPLGPDPDDLAATTASPAFAEATSAIDAAIGDRAFITRVDRIELSKNVLRGFDAFASLLEAEPERHGRVVFGAYVYPSRSGVAAYDRYRDEVARRVAAINERYGTAGWQPILYDPRDDYPRSMAALARADVVLVNPIRDGLNLVAKESMVINRRDAQLVLSPEAGAWEEMHAGAWRADPFDVGATARALADALDAPAEERARRAGLLREAATASSPATWLAANLAAADGSRE